MDVGFLQQFPVKAYEEPAFLWKQSNWRCPRKVADAYACLPEVCLRDLSWHRLTWPAPASAGRPALVGALARE